MSNPHGPGSPEDFDWNEPDSDQGIPTVADWGKKHLQDVEAARLEGADHPYIQRARERGEGFLTYGYAMAEKSAAGSDEIDYRRKDNKPATEGYYKMGDLYYKVVRAVHGSGNLYAKVMIVIDKTDGSGDKKGRWDYVPGVIKQLDSSMALTPELAKEFGDLYAVCVMCGSTLTREESKDRGYGPTCADNNGWPYDHSRKG